MHQYHIQSTALEHVNVENLGKRVMASCDCPRLKTYVCNGAGPYVDGTLPIFTEAQYYLIEVRDPRSVHVGVENEPPYILGRNMVATAGHFSELPHFSVPTSCQFTLRDFYFGSNTFDYYDRFAREVANAVYREY